MKRLFTALLVLTTLGPARAQERLGPREAFELVQQGTASCSIIVAERPSPAARLAALELQYHLLKISGAEVPIRSENDRVEGRWILVGESSATRRFGFRSVDFKPQEYLIAFRTNTIILIGRDWEDTEANRKVEGRPMAGETLQALRHKMDYWKTVGYPDRSVGEMELPGVYDDQGTCLATYDFLERCCGVRWYGPSAVSIVIPSRRCLSAAGDDIRRSPALKHRSALPGGNWPFLHGQWGDFTPDQVHLYWRRIRQGGERWAGNHTFHRNTIKALFNDPEYQSKNPQSQGSQLCYTNPKLINQVAQMARDYFDGKGELPVGWKALGDYFAIVPDDNMNLCNCPTCEALLRQGRAQKTGFFSSGEMSDYWFTFVNAVAREVRKTHPDKYVATLAYWAYALPPSFSVEPNVSIAPCLHTCYYPVHAGMRENDMKFYREWREKTKAPMFLWVYYHHPMEPALIGKWNCFPHVMVHETAKAMRMFIQDGVRGIFECGEQDQLEQYVMVKVWDNPNLDVDALISEFFRLYFGPAAEPMKRFYLRLEEIACDQANYPAPYHRRDGIDWKKVAWERLGTPERMEELGGLMAQAENLAVMDPEKQRVALWRKALWDWMCQGRDQYRLVITQPMPLNAAALAYAPAPADNPLKGFVPYPGDHPTFPHSLEWDYTRLSEVMTGPTNFDWTLFERKLDAAAARGCQFIARFYLEYPNRKTGVPQFLLDQGLTLRTWTNTSAQANRPAVNQTPDYEDLRLRAALTNFIHALGTRYDGDPRLGFIEIGLLGMWGEWHDWVKDDWFASKKVQREVMDAYEAAFKQTRLVARYPAGPDHTRYADNSQRPLGYHDDSFAWGTMHTGRKGDGWFFETLLREAGVLEKWRRQPIGGEVRPEVWDCLFDEPSCAPKGQDFDTCLAVTHVSWLCNQGAFRPALTGASRERAIRAVQRMGYELQVTSADLAATGRELAVTLSMTNRGVAPFYYNWPVELGALGSAGALAATWTTAWKLTTIQPGEDPVRWQHHARVAGLMPGHYRLLLRVPNPMPSGKPLRFANQAQDRDRQGWLTLGELELGRK